MKAYHYSCNNIKDNSIILSNQNNDSERLFNKVWNIYNQVAKIYGINNFPIHYGYAYPNKRKNMSRKIEYVVESPDDKVIKGNLNYSLYCTMSMIHELKCKDKEIPLKYRALIRESNIISRAHNYFTKLENPKEIELISSCWKSK